MTAQKKESFRTRSLSGTVIEVRKYYDGVILSTARGKVFVRKEIIEDILGQRIESISDYEKTLVLAGKRITASGPHRKWYGGAHRSFIEAHYFRLEENHLPSDWKNLTDEEKRHILENILNETLTARLSKRRKRNMIEKLLLSPETVFRYSNTSVEFTSLFTLYKIVSGNSFLPFSAIPAALNWAVEDMYHERRLLTLKYSEAVEHILIHYFLRLPEAEDARKYTGNKIFIVNREENDFTYTSWKIRETLKRVIMWVMKHVKEEVDEREVEDILTEVLTTGRINLTEEDMEKIITTGAFPSLLIQTILDNRKVVMITGTGGSGKTTLIKELSQMLKEDGKQVHVCALTGRASDRVGGETIAYTLMHGIPHTARYVFIDEVFTVDLFTFNSLTYLLNGRKVLFAGDPEQNPPPEGYDVFRNVIYPILVKSGNVVEGTETYRYIQEKPEVIVYTVPLTEKNVRWCLEETVSSFLKEGASWFVATTLHWKQAGTKELNRMIKSLLGKNPDEFETGDKVIFTRNIKLNGRVVERTGYEGEILEVNGNEIMVAGKKSGERFRVSRSDIAPGYAFELYHAQGREADYVVLFIPAITGDMEDFRRKLKVGVTRARRKTFLFTYRNIYEKFLKDILEEMKSDGLINLKIAGTIKKSENEKQTENIKK